MRLARPKVRNSPPSPTASTRSRARSTTPARRICALNRRLITAQDDERRRTALELHDEVGPSLFGLKANAASIAKAAGALPEHPARVVGTRARPPAIIDHLQSINRSMLNRLRPMALGHVPLDEILGELVHDRARQHPHIAFTHHVERSAAATATPST